MRRPNLLKILSQGVTKLEAGRPMRSKGLRDHGAISKSKQKAESELPF
jgi:hypothetical protein